MLIPQRSALIFELNKKNCFFLKPSFYICRKYINSPSKKRGSKKNASDVLWFWLASYKDKVKTKAVKLSKKRNKTVSLPPLSDRSVSESMFDICNWVINSPHLRDPIGTLGSPFEWPFCQWEYVWYMQLSYQFSTPTGSHWDIISIDSVNFPWHDDVNCISRLEFLLPARMQRVLACPTRMPVLPHFMSMLRTDPESLKLFRGKVM